MTNILATEERRPDDIQEQVQPSIPKSFSQRLSFDARLWMHLAVVAVVASAALLGGNRLSPSTSQTARQSVPAPAPRAEPMRIPEAAGPTSLPDARVATAVSSTPDRAEPTLATKPADSNSRPEDAVVEALSYHAEPLADLAAPGQGEGVIVTRAMASSRGGARSLDPTPTPLPAPTAVPTPAPTLGKEPVKPRTYKVRAGDTLLGIAASFGITPETVLWANDLGNGELLQIDQELTILPVSGVLHKVRKGETFNAIAEAYTADAARIIEANLIANTDQLQEGQVLIVPGGMMRTVSIASLPAAPSQQEIAAAPKYTVKPGDTLLTIADAFGVRASVIQVANNLMDPDKLQIGQALSIPGAKQASAAAPRPQPASPASQPPTAAAPPAKPTAPPQPAKPVEPPAPPAPEPEPEPAAVARSGGDRIATLAQQYLGYRYLWGGHSPKTGFDCSGFTWYVYKEAGINIPMHDLAGQLNAGPRIGRDKLLPGDLVFFENTYKPGLSHSGLYLGGGRFINAETEAVGVQIRSLSDPYWAARYVGASRPW